MNNLAYQKGLDAVHAAAGMEKTALNEKLLGRLLSKEYGQQEWDTRGILRAMRTGEQVPVGAVDTSEGQTQIRRVIQGWSSDVDPAYLEPDPARTQVSNVLRKRQLLGEFGRTPRGAVIGEDELPEYRARVERLISRNRDRGAADRDRLLQQAETVMRSGRHSDDAFIDPSTIRTVDPATGDVLGGTGFRPDSLVWRGAPHPLSPLGVPKGAPRWVSAHPDVSMGYIENVPGGELSAYNLARIAPDARGPYTRHVAQDTRGWDGPAAEVAEQAAGKSGWGNSPFYEMVVDQDTLHDAMTHRYKVMPSKKLMRVFGDAATDPLRQQ